MDSLVSCVSVKTFLLTPSLVLLPLLVVSFLVVSFLFISSFSLLLSPRWSFCPGVRFLAPDRRDGNDAEIILACTAEKGTAARTGRQVCRSGGGARARACLKREQPAEETARRTDYLLDTRPREINCRAVFA